MDKEKVINSCIEYAKKCLKDNDPGHDFLHVERVRKTALSIAKSLQCDTFLVELLAILHDIEDHKFISDNEVIDFLSNIDISDEYKDKILYILPYLSFSKYPKLPDDFPIEGKIISDADRLDAIGAIGVARAFSYGGRNNRPMYGEDNSTIKHFDDKLLQLDQYLYFDVSKKIAKKRMNFLKQFYDEFNDEIKKTQ